MQKLQKFAKEEKVCKNASPSPGVLQLQYTKRAVMIGRYLRKEDRLAGSKPVSSRVPLSLRLPQHVVERVDDYARAHRVSKTDAFLHFLQKGMAADESAVSLAQLDDIKEQLNQIKALLSEGKAPKAESQEAVSNAIVHAAEVFPAISKAYLFGSFARADFNGQSDVDIRLELDDSLPFTLHDLAQFQKDVERTTGRETDVISAQKVKNSNLAAAIEREKVLVYERQS